MANAMPVTAPKWTLTRNDAVHNQNHRTDGFTSQAAFKAISQSTNKNTERGNTFQIQNTAK